MSFAVSDNGEFPPLEKLNEDRGNGRRDKSNKAKLVERPAYELLKNIDEDFPHGRLGLQLIEYNEDLRSVLSKNRIGGLEADFILIPMSDIQSDVADPRLIPDLVLPNHVWEYRVAVAIDYPGIKYQNFDCDRNFALQLEYAMYLPVSVIIINCPKSRVPAISVASIVNQQYPDMDTKPYLLFRESKDPKPLDESTVWSEALQRLVVVSHESNEDQRQSNGEPKKETTQEGEETLLESSFDDCSSSLKSDDVECSVDDRSGVELATTSHSSDSNSDRSSFPCENPWKAWNNIRAHMIPDERIGVCLDVDDDLVNSTEDELNRWTGEPVRILMINIDQFSRQPSDMNSVRLSTKCRDFIKKIVIATSFRTSLILNQDSMNKQMKYEDLREYIVYLKEFARELKATKDPWAAWNDTLQIPLQPLSSNLNSSTYNVFESDSIKYITYRRAMVEALMKIREQNQDRQEFILMVVGAGRGPLVDALIQAFGELNSNLGIKYKIYALDKNFCSIRSLKYKKKTLWDGANGLYEVDIVQSDMREWNPGFKADLIVSELLGSLGDNELSPECIDGLWRLATPSTINIPQQYTSYIGPICNYRLHQKLHQLDKFKYDVFDRIYLSRFANCYNIAAPVPLFSFNHDDVSKNPEDRSNERYAKLVFYSKTNTVCHGFAGYFTAKLFGSVKLSTLYTDKTPEMESWFPVFIPLDQPVLLKKGSKIELHFWRKESPSSVWYEWLMTKPVMTRFYSPGGLGTSMSKFT